MALVDKYILGLLLIRIAQSCPAGTEFMAGMGMSIMLVPPQVAGAEKLLPMFVIVLNG